MCAEKYPMQQDIHKRYKRSYENNAQVSFQRGSKHPREKETDAERQLKFKRSIRSVWGVNKSTQKDKNSNWNSDRARVLSHCAIVWHPVIVWGGRMKVLWASTDSTEEFNHRNGRRQGRGGGPQEVKCRTEGELMAGSRLVATSWMDVTPASAP